MAPPPTPTMVRNARGKNVPTWEKKIPLTADVISPSANAANADSEEFADCVPYWTDHQRSRSAQTANAQAPTLVVNHASGHTEV